MLIGSTNNDMRQIIHDIDKTLIDGSKIENKLVNILYKFVYNTCFHT